MGYAQLKDRPRVLFVDDEQRVLNSMRIMFRREYELYLAPRGADALKIVRENEIDVIVADHRMPEMTGVEVLSRVREVSPRTVRILLTGYADLDAVEGSINDCEVFRFLTKPCPPNQLKDTVALAAQLARETTGAIDVTATPEEEVELILESSASAEHLAVASGPQPVTRPSPPVAAAPAPAPGNDPEAGFDPTTTSTIEPSPQTRTIARAPGEGQRRLPRGLGIIVFSTDDEVRDVIQRAVRGRVPVYGATNIVKVVKLLEQHQPGVLVTDVSDDKATIQSMTARLKQHLPELVTIAVSQHRDVLDMVWLINHGQIFRFLRKPLSPGRSAVCLQAALKHHRMLLKNPDLVRRHEVAETDSGGLVDGMLAKLRLVRRLWASA
jgi:DNA-binding NtrC family response regulator